MYVLYQNCIFCTYSIVLKIERRCSFTNEIKNIKEVFLLNIFRGISPPSMFFISFVKLQLLSIFNIIMFHLKPTPHSLSKKHILYIKHSLVRSGRKPRLLQNFYSIPGGSCAPSCPPL